MAITSKMRLPRFVRWYIATRLGLSEKAADQIRIAVRSFSRTIDGEARVTHLKKPLVIRWLKGLHESGRSPATVNSKRRMILTIWRAAEEEGLVYPPPRIPRLIEPTRLPVAWTLDEIERILSASSAAKGIWRGVPAALAWPAGLLVCWDTACRLGTLLKAQLAQVDFAAGTFRVPAEHLKGRRGDRLFKLHPQTIEAIKRTLVPTRRTGHLFPFPRGTGSLAKEYRKLLARAGLPQDRRHLFHCIRRTAESYAASANGIEWAARAVGHSPAVARHSYVSPKICQPPSLVEVLPRPTF